jgi:hypothetical protein
MAVTELTFYVGLPFAFRPIAKPLRTNLAPTADLHLPPAQRLSTTDLYGIPFRNRRPDRKPNILRGARRPLILVY